MCRASGRRSDRPGPSLLVRRASHDHHEADGLGGPNGAGLPPASARRPWVVTASFETLSDAGGAREISTELDYGPMDELLETRVKDASANVAREPPWPTRLGRVPDLRSGPIGGTPSTTRSARVREQHDSRPARRQLPAAWSSLSSAMFWAECPVAPYALRCGLHESAGG